jgi:hypothetical protein
MKAETKIGIRNEFLFEVKDAITGEVKESFKAFNTICKGLIERYCSTIYIAGSQYSPFSNIRYGDGAGTPGYNDTALFRHIATLNASTVEAVKTLPTMKLVRTARIAADQANGKVITEVGFEGAGSNTLSTHAMIVDSEGLPVGITKTATDVIDIYATVFFDIQDLETDFAGTVGWTTYLADGNGDYYSGRKQTPFANFLMDGAPPSSGITAYGEVHKAGKDVWGSAQRHSSGATSTADIPNKKRKFTARFTETQGNGPIEALQFQQFLTVSFPTAGAWAGMAKTGVVVGTGDGINKKFDLPHKDAKNLKVYQNGVEVPAEQYTHHKKNYVQNNAWYSFSWQPDTYQGICHIEQLTTAPNKVILYDIKTHALLFSVLDQTLRENYVGSLALTPLFAKQGNAKPRYGTLLNDTVLFVCGHYWRDIHFYDFDKETMTVGTKWTNHANFPTYASNPNIATTLYSPKVVGRGNEPFGICFVGQNAASWIGPNNQNMFSFSLDAVNKVVGANIAYAPNVGSYSVAQVSPNPISNALAVIAGSVLKTIPYEFATGTFGAAVGTYAANLVLWKADGLRMYVPKAGSGDKLLLWNPADNTYAVIKEVTAETISYNSGENVNIITQQGNALSLYTASFYPNVRHGKVNDDEIALYNYIYETRSGYSGSWIYWREYTGSSTSLSCVREVFPGIFAITWNPINATLGTNMAQLMFLKLEGTGTHNLVFNAPVPAAAAITADYSVDYIPKDANHILDVELTLQFSGT